MLRKLLEKDAEKMLKCMKDDSVTKYMRIDGKDLQLSDCIKFIENSFTKHNANFAIVDENDNWCGTISLKNIDYKVKQAEYAIITSSEVHGKGYALQATNEILRYAFNELNLDRVYLNVTSDNVRANKFYLKCGFIYEGCFRNAIYVKGNIYNLNWYSILKSEFLS